MADEQEQDPQARQELVTQFTQITGSSQEDAESYLQQSLWDYPTALNTWFASDQEGPQQPHDEPDNTEQNATDLIANDQGTGGGRTLGGDGIPSRHVPGPSQPAAGSSSRPGRGGMATLRDLQQPDSHAGHGHGNDDSDDDGEDDEQEYFAGGDKSGLAVQNPHSAEEQINRVLKRAARNAPRPGGDDEEPSRPSHFGGRGQTLGGDDAPSTFIEPITSQISTSPQRVHRELHLWRNGFSIDDGPLFRFDDPANAAVLDMINRGRAPLEILNVEQGQEVDLQVHPHRDEDFKQPKRKYAPFSGEGQRLGSPVPGIASSSTAPSSSSQTQQTSASSSSAAAPSASSGPTVDDSQPTITLQIRLGDGTQLRSRFNTTHTINDVYGFVDAASTASRDRSYVLMTTFPSKELSDRDQVLGDLTEFKRGGVVVQKWT